MFIGTDIIEISRFTIDLLQNDNFMDRYFTKMEQEYCQGASNPAEHFAARFAGKEAAIKALSGIRKTLPFNKIEIINDENGRPNLILYTDDPEILALKKDISLSHSEKDAIAFVVMWI